MSPDVLATGSGLAAVWVLALSRSIMRSIRTIGVLLTATVLFVLTTFLPPPLGVPVRLGLLLATVWGLHSYSQWFLALRGPVRQFEAVYSATMRSLEDLGQRRVAGELSPSAFAAGLQDVERRLSAAAPPDEAWSALRDQAVAHLASERRLYEGILGGKPASESELDRGRRAGSALIDRHRSLRLQYRSFWAK